VVDAQRSHLAAIPGTSGGVTLGDVATPALDLLLGPEALNVLSAAVAEYGCRLEDLRAADVNVDPSGAAVVVMYVAGVRHTFAINAAGSFVLGMVAVLCHNRPGWFLLLGTGFCGGFTTFSTFSVEALSLFEKDRPGAAIGYMIGSVVAGILGAWAGLKLARGG
jgi:protein CrcB